MKKKKPTQTFQDLVILKKIALSANLRIADLSGLPHETVDEFLARGGMIKKIPSSYKEPKTRWAKPKNIKTDYLQTIYDWRI